MTYLAQFQKPFSSREDLEQFIDGSLLGHPYLEFGGSSYKGDGAIPVILVDIPCLHMFTHEGGHVLDFWVRGQPERLMVRGFGFHYPTHEVCGGLYEEPRNTRGLHTEFRAVAWQMLLLNLCGVEFDVKAFAMDMAKSLTSGVGALDDAMLIPLRKGVVRQARSCFRRIAVDNGVRKRDPMAFREAIANRSQAFEAYKMEKDTNKAEYACKHIMKYFLRYRQADVLALWHEALSYIHAHRTLHGHLERAS